MCQTTECMLGAILCPTFALCLLNALAALFVLFYKVLEED